MSEGKESSNLGRFVELFVRRENSIQILFKDDMFFFVLLKHSLSPRVLQPG